MRFLSYGGGVNSAAMLLSLVERGESIDGVVFADTGGERPETYAHLRHVEQWCGERGIAFLRATNAGRGQGDSLEENCLKRRELPSLAYGFKGCSVKWKRQPMDRLLRDLPEVRAAWARGELVERCIGIDAGETRRRKLPPDDKWTYRYPLCEFGLDREGCVATIQRHGWPMPPKSSCFFCPAMRKAEIKDLAATHPDLVRRALAIEDNAVTHTVKGLGRSWSWRDFLTSQGVSFPEHAETPCDCMDGGGDDE